VVPGRPAHVLEITCTQAFLARRRAPVRKVTPEELFLELVHTGAGEKKRRVIRRDKAVARNYLMALRPEKLQVEPS